MRQVAYWLNDKVSVDILLRFCEIESLLAVDLSKQQEPGSYVFFLTDDEDKLKKYISISDAPCFINSEARFSHSYYILNGKFGISSLRLLMDSIHHGGTLWNAVRDVDFLTIHKKLKVGNNIVDEIERLVIMNTWELLHYCPFGDVEKIRIGFSEMLMNAIEHGNLAITEDEKHESTEEGTYHDLLAQRLADPRYKDRQVRITIELTEGRKKKQPVKRLSIAIKDEGAGFDVSNAPSPADDPMKLLDLHGRGILITRAYFDTVSYNDKGNEVTLVKAFGDIVEDEGKNND